MQVLKVNSQDTVLTLTSGGCNALNLLLHGAGHVGLSFILHNKYHKPIEKM